MKQRGAMTSSANRGYMREMIWETAKTLVHVAFFVASIGLFLWIGRIGGRKIAEKIQTIWIRVPALMIWAVAPPLLLMLSAGWPLSMDYEQTMVGFGFVLLGFHFLFWSIGTIWGASQASRR